MKHRVFVYGTLKSGHYNHRVLTMGRTSKLLVDDAFIKGEMFNLGAYPAVVDGEKPVKGEIWIVDEDTLSRLDHLEGHPKYYQRREVPILYSSDFVVWAYMMKKEALPKNAVPMPVGNWPNIR